MLDIGTSGYTNSRIRRNADVHGYTGYAELRAANSYDMCLNLSTTRTDEGWMYFKINNDDYMQLSSSDNNVNIYKDTSISGTLEAQRLSITNTSSRPTEIKNTMHNGPYLAAISQNHSNNDLLFALRCLPLNQLWCFGAATSNQYIISHEISTKLSMQPNGNTTISGNLDVGSGCSSKISLHANTNDYTGYSEVHCSLPWELTLNVETNSPNGGYMFFKLKGVLFMITRGDHQTMNYYKPLVNPSDDRLKENEELIENACETLSKLRP